MRRPRPARRRRFRLPHCVSEALLDPDFWPRLAAAPALALLLAAGIYRDCVYALGSAVVAGGSLAAQGWLKRRARRREHDTVRRLLEADPIADDQRNTRRPPEGKT
jgi:hypothetical protein